MVDDVTFRRLCRARDFLASQFNESVTLERAAREACLSPFHFHRVFVRAFGETPHDFVTRLRIGEARRLLEAGNLRVTDVCLEVGYASLGAFSSRFAAVVGQSPLAYRREARRWIAPVGGWRIHCVPSCFLRSWIALQNRKI
jgi:AraC-like DNA-binding protein